VADVESATKLKREDVFQEGREEEPEAQRGEAGSLRPQVLGNSKVSELLRSIVLLDCSRSQSKWHHTECIKRCLVLKLQCPFCRQEGVQRILSSHNNHAPGANVF